MIGARALRLMMGGSAEAVDERSVLYCSKQSVASRQRIEPTRVLTRFYWSLT
jgi:hypothetical protein